MLLVELLPLLPLSEWYSLKQSRLNGSRQGNKEQKLLNGTLDESWKNKQHECSFFSYVSGVRAVAGAVKNDRNL